jgi:hypothetical protein
VFFRLLSLFRDSTFLGAVVPRDAIPPKINVLRNVV